MECDASHFDEYIHLNLVYRYDVPVQLGILFIGNYAVGRLYRGLLEVVFAGQK